jgi:hypothetical protein
MKWIKLLRAFFYCCFLIFQLQGMYKKRVCLLNDKSEKKKISYFRMKSIAKIKPFSIDNKHYKNKSEKTNTYIGTFWLTDDEYNKKTGKGLLLASKKGKNINLEIVENYTLKENMGVIKTYFPDEVNVITILNLVFKLESRGSRSSWYYEKEKYSFLNKLWMQDKAKQVYSMGFKADIDFLLNFNQLNRERFIYEVAYFAAKKDKQNIAHVVANIYHVYANKI